MNVTREPQHFGFLDSLRGIAALAVVATHTAQNQPPGFFTPIGGYAFYGVQLFYIVSAFSLCLSLEQRNARETAPYRNYMLRRFFRIAPLFWLALAVYLLKPYVLPASAAPVDLHPPTWPVNGTHVLVTLLFLNGWHYRTINSIVLGGWSVAVESNFYLLLPKLQAWVRSLPSALLLVVATLVFGLLCRSLLYSAFGDDVPPEDETAFGIFATMWLPSQLCVFALGIVMYRLVPRASIGWRGWAPRRWALPLLTMVVGLLAGVFAPLEMLRFVPLFFPYSVGLLGFAWLLAWMPHRLLVNRLTVFFGRISYSLYLFHIVVMHVLLWLVPAVRDLPYPVFFLLVVLATTVIATVTHRYVELGGMALGKRLISRLERPAKDNATAPA